MSEQFDYCIVHLLFHLPQRHFNEITIYEEVWDEVVVHVAGLRVPYGASYQVASDIGAWSFASFIAA